jgi:hypothetical protein
MKIISAIILSILSIFSARWARNDVFKFYGADKKEDTFLLDFENVNFENEFIRPLSYTNGWIRSKNVFVGEGYVFSSVFVNAEFHNTNSYIQLDVRNAFNDEIIQRGKLTKTGGVPLVDVFDKNVYVSLEFVGSDIRLYSFGIRRKLARVLGEGDISIFPTVFFYGEGNLFIDFRLRFPATLDIIVFNSEGAIIDYIVSNQYLREGRYSFEWDPRFSAAKGLPSGAYFVYFNAESIDGKKIRITKRFDFVNR